MKMKDLGEFGFIDRIKRETLFRPDSVIKGIGDDCSVCRSSGDLVTLLTTDMLVEDVHFRRDSMPPEKLGRKWIGSDLGKFDIHTTRKRLIGVQRQLKADNKSWRAFEILNLGKYERQHYIGVNLSLREEEKQKQQAQLIRIWFLLTMLPGPRQNPQPESRWP